ncbi:TonB-dependent receptor [Mesonia sp. MT50]|uniref:TonB-dependent receptor n=1 Tax=Mesonia profundi TaxID=3070998 RepID=A0ABU1A487_9FLAO|nr:TonB-dependent receptor [Mesonia profundi]MDQ7918081.1 TonB-dependent receptor [Mesonia profundi]
MKNVFLVLMLLSTSFLFAQGIVKGTITDSEMKTPLPGANVMVAGTSNGTTTDFDGNFSLNVADASGKIVISYVGFLKKEIEFTVANGKTVNLGEIVLEADDSALDEIVITSFSLAIDRKTPVAVSTIKAKDIENRLGNQEFPEILKSTPGVYATKKGGGFGDAELRLRGFNSENIAVMINGVPVNGMENGRVYWSNWAGLSDVTRTMQVQRGLGASKVAVPSIGGTVNIVTKTTDAKEGGSFFATTGNDGYQKFGATVSTGKLENGFAITASGSKTTGRGFIDATSFEGYSYFLNVSKDFGDDHQLSFSAFGAPQVHSQRRNRESIEDFRRNDRETKFNRDWGYKNGQEYNINENRYHKPQMSLNHYWNISDKTSLSTAVYASFGRGAGSRSSGVNKFGLGTDYRSGEFQPINFDKIVEENKALGALGSESVITEDINNHNWYGALSTITTELTSDIDLLAGIDLRYYKGEHYREVKDLLGGQFYNDDSNINNPVNNAQVGDNVSFYNDGIVLRGGGFAQVEYSKDDLSAFISVAASNTSYKRIDYFNYLDSDSERETDFVKFFGYSAKGGANYNIDNNHNVFANVGYFERAPFFNAIFLNYQNDVNDEAENQKIFSAELGYGFRSENLRVNFNVYRTSWKDRTLTRSFQNPDGTFGSANILGINALHQGVELDVDYKPFDKLKLRGMISIGDWTWQDDVTGVQVFDDEQQLVNTIDIYIEDLKVGDAAQTTFGLGLDYSVLERTTLRLDYNYYDKFYADFEPNSRTSANSLQAWETPAYGLLDLGLTHGFKLGALDATIIGNINNILDTEYIADARDGALSSAGDASVWYGFGRTYTIGAKIKF